MVNHKDFRYILPHAAHEGELLCIHQNDPLHVLPPGQSVGFDEGQARPVKREERPDIAVDTPRQYRAGSWIEFVGCHQACHSIKVCILMGQNQLHLCVPTRPARSQKNALSPRTMTIIAGLPVLALLSAR